MSERAQAPTRAPSARAEGAERAAGPHPLRILPSLLSSDFARLADELARAEAAGADWHHVDVMDGHFVPNLTIGPPVVAKIHAAAKRPLDVHLMITDPVGYAPRFVEAGAHCLTFHAELCADDAALCAMAEGMRASGVPLVGVALNPDTPLERVEAALELVDLVLVMSVFPGFGGQRFHPEVLSKARALRERGYDGLLEMDGGIDTETVSACAANGADTLVAGSALYGAQDMRATLSMMRQRAEAARGARR